MQGHLIHRGESHQHLRSIRILGQIASALPGFITDKNALFRKMFFNPYLIPFFISFYLVGDYIFPSTVSLLQSGDAHSIWQTIISFRDESIKSSYVLYKGFLSVYPYIWLYELAVYLELDHFLFIKIYHAILFSFVAAVGVPYIVSRILCLNIKLYKNIVFVVILFFSLKFTLIFNALMVDLPTWAFFVAAIGSAILALNLDYPKKIFVLVVSGVFVGLTLCSSGQYSLAGYLLMAYVFVSIFGGKGILGNILNIKLIALFGVFLIAVAIPKIYDSYFEESIVQPMRDRGEWLPTGQQWLTNGMTRLMPHYKFGYQNENNRALAILKQTEGDKFSERYERIKQGGGEYSVEEYLGMVRANPLDFTVMWAAKTFLAVSFDGGKVRVSHLLISYTALYVCLYLVFLKCIYFRDLINRNSLIFLSVIGTIAAPVFLSIEMRYIVALQGFMLGFSIHQEKIFSNIKNYIMCINNRGDKFGLGRMNGLAIPYPAIFYVIFLIVCFTLYGALLEIHGSDPDMVLYRW